MSDIFVFDRIPNQPGRLGIDFVTAEGALIGEGGYGKVIKAITSYRWEGLCHQKDTNFQYCLEN